MPKQDSPVVAILCADLHFSHRPPSLRSKENWYEVMERNIRELRKVAADYDVPVICAGDIFDRWYEPAELINFVAAGMPTVYAVPGQHDLPYHSMDNLRKSAYWTLMQMGTVKNLNHHVPVYINPTISVSGFAYGSDLKPLAGVAKNYRSRINVAVAHRFVWSSDYNKYQGASTTGLATNVANALKGFDVAVFGDNHTPFYVPNQTPKIYNCGTFIRRTSRDLRENPRLGLLHENGKISYHYLDTTQDIYDDKQTVRVGNEEITLPTDFVDELKEMETHGRDFREAVLRWVTVNNVGSKELSFILEALGETV